MKNEEIWDAYNALFISKDVDRLRKVLVRYNSYLLTKELPGDVVECGVFKGVGLMQWLKFLVIHEQCSLKRVIGFDFFTEFVGSMSPEEEKSVKEFVEDSNFKGADVGLLREIADDIGPNKLELVSGDACKTIPEYVSKNTGMRISLLHLDFDIYEPTLVALNSFWPVIVKGGLILIDEYGCRGWGESDAIDEFFKDKNVKILSVPHSIKPSAYVIK